MAKARTPIPTSIAAAVLFAADRTCCVCRELAKPIQIHHIDDDPTNHDPVNLAVLCVGCHEVTQIKGGFSRRLDADQIRLYRDNWVETVAARRSTSTSSEDFGRRFAGGYDAQLATSLVEINREAKNWVNLVFVYEAVGNKDLRDKTVEKAIDEGVTDQVLVLLRRFQGRVADVPPAVIASELERLTKQGAYRELTPLYEDLARYREAAEAYINGLSKDLSKFSTFTLAHHLKEFEETEVIPGLFVQALQEAADEDDFWWQVRALEELGWTTELHEFVLENEDRIDSDPDLGGFMRAHLRIVAAEARGDRHAVREARIALECMNAETDWNSESLS
jgi:hypothetical protein